MRHLLSIEDLDRAAIERILDRAESFAEVSEREIKKVPALRGRTRAQPLLRGLARARARPSSSPPSALSADVVNFVASGLERREGRVAEGHGPDARPPTSPTAIVIRTPHAGAAALVAALDAAPRSSTPATASTSTRPRRCSTSTRCAQRLGVARRRERSGSSATSCTRASRARTSSPSTKMGAKVTVCGPPTLIPRGIEALGCEVALHARRARARPTSSTRCGCSTSA